MNAAFWPPTCQYRVAPEVAECLMAQITCLRNPVQYNFNELPFMCTSKLQSCTTDHGDVRYKVYCIQAGRLQT